MRTPAIRTERLLLREFVEDDWSAKRRRRVSTYYYAIRREEWGG